LPKAARVTSPDTLLASLTFEAKGEFETEESYRERIRVDSTACYLFAAAGDAIKYNTESQTYSFPVYLIDMPIEFEWRSQIRSGGRRFQRLDISWKRTVTGHGVGQNAFGVKRTYEKVKVTNFRFFIPRDGSRSEPVKHALTFGMPLSEAQAAKSHLRLAYLWAPDSSVAGSPVLSKTDYSGPTIDVPYEGIHYEYYFVVSKLWAVVYDDRNRKVYLKESLFEAGP
jgi:hypothetical protein